MASFGANPSGVQKTMLPFNSDAFIIGVNTHASRCMDNNKAHFTNLDPSAGKVVKGIASILTIAAHSTIHWDVKDDNGRCHHFSISHASYVPALPHALLSPQHWAEEANNDFPWCHGTYSVQHSDCNISFWGQSTYKKTTPNDAAINTPSFWVRLWSLQVSTICPRA